MECLVPSVQSRIERSHCAVPRRGSSSESGQALVEHILFMLLGVVVILGTFQLYLTGWTIQRSIGAAHAVLFKQAYRHNCAEQRESAWCTYNTDTRGKVIWSPRVLPEVRIPTIDLFTLNGVPPAARLWSNSPLNRQRTPDERCPGQPCKRTKLGVGTWRSLDAVFGVAEVDVPPLARLVLAGK